MNKRKILTYAAIAIAAVALIGYVTYLIFALTNPDRLRNVINDSVRSEIAAIDLPVPKDGKDASLDDIRTIVREYLIANPPKDGTDGINGVNGKDATHDQIKRAVDEYMQVNPPRDGKDGTDGENGRTALTRCNVEKNRWEVRFSVLDTWQLLNGEKVRCTTEAK